MKTNPTKKDDEFLYRMAISLKQGLADVQKYVGELNNYDELAELLEQKGNPIDNVRAALYPLIVQVADILDYTEAATGRMELSMDEVDLYAMLDGMMMMADQLADQKDGRVKLEEDFEKDLPPIQADAARLTQALLNLIHNAFKFTDTGYVIVRVRLEDGNILFEVRDTGIGISDEDQELVFEPFETILLDKEDPRLGYGIGLMIVEHIIDLHGGQTWFESKAGTGSSFYFTVPV